MEKYLITGATGYVGSMFIKDLMGFDAEITAIVRDPSKAEGMFGKNISYLVGDITDKAFMDSIEGEYDYCLHFAATTKSSEMIAKPVETLDGIVTGTKNVLETALRCAVNAWQT